MAYDGVTFIPNGSYVDMLQDYHPEGLWINGVTILHIIKLLPPILKGTDRVAIMHFGASETFTHPPANFLSMCCAHLLRQDMEPSLFQAYVVPKMFAASNALAHNRTEYFRLIEPSDFERMLDQVLWMLQGTRTLFIGMSQPNSPDHPHWVNQAWEKNEIMKRLCIRCNVKFLHIWDDYKEYIQDSTHFNTEGHKKLFNEIQTFIQEGK